MPRTHVDPSQRPLALALHGILLSAAAGAAFGVLSARHVIDDHGYDSLGMWRTVFRSLTESSRVGMVCGAAAGIVLAACAFWANYRVPQPASAPSARSLWSAIRAGSNDVVVVLATLAAGASACLAVVSYTGGLRGHELISVVVATVLAFVWIARARQLGALHARAFTGVVLFAGAALSVWTRRARFLALSGADAQIGNGALLSALAISSVVFLWPVLESIRFAPPRRAWHFVLLVPLEACALLPVALPLWPQPKSSIAAPTGAPNVLIIGIDTLRADHTTLLGPAENGRELTPQLARLAARGTVFTSAISQAPWTMPAFASMLTGKYPHEHGAISKKGYLREREVTLAEILREAGFDTGAIVSHYFVNDTHGFRQGYDSFDDDMAMGEEAITSERVTDRGIAWLKRERSRPFMLFMHYFDPHYEYREHPGSTFADGYDSWLKDELQTQNVRHKRHWLGAAERQWLVDLYDEEIVHTDREIGRLLEYLGSAGLDRNTLIVVVADHGEEFFERGWLGHSITLYDEVIHVPLAIVWPGSQPHASRVRAEVETRSLFSTVLDAVQVAWTQTRPAPSLLPLGTGAQVDAPDPSRRAFSSVWTPDAGADTGLRARIFSVRTERWKLVWDQARQLELLFDLENDPAERTDVSKLHAQEFAALHSELDTWVQRQKASLPSTPRRNVTGGEADKLRALGYL